jgi:hypothetical protein
MGKKVQIVLHQHFGIKHKRYSTQATKREAKDKSPSGGLKWQYDLFKYTIHWNINAPFIISTCPTLFFFHQPFPRSPFECVDTFFKYRDLWSKYEFNLWSPNSPQYCMPHTANNPFSHFPHPTAKINIFINTKGVRVDQRDKSNCELCHLSHLVCVLKTKFGWNMGQSGPFGCIIGPVQPIYTCWATPPGWAGPVFLTVLILCNISLCFINSNIH